MAEKLSPGSLLKGKREIKISLEL